MCWRMGSWTKVQLLRFLQLFKMDSAEELGAKKIPEKVIFVYFFGYLICKCLIFKLDCGERGTTIRTLLVVIYSHRVHKPLKRNYTAIQLPCRLLA